MVDMPKNKNQATSNPPEKNIEKGTKTTFSLTEFY